MNGTSYAVSPDGTRIAFDRTGAGPALVLLHGGGVTRHDWRQAGYPIRMAEMLAGFEGTTYVARVAVNKPANLKKARKSIIKAFEAQVNLGGFGFVEVLSACPTDWGVTPRRAIEKVDEDMIPYFPLGVFKDEDTAAEEK